MATEKKTMVISGINLFEGGPLSVFKDFLDAIINQEATDEYDVTIFVHKVELFKEYEGKFEIKELPKSRKSYVFRLFYEYIYFYFYSLKRNIDIWISLHDITPNVRANRRYVYCHNPSPFLKRTEMIRKISKTNYYMSLFYKYLYRINIEKNTAVIVQQDWIRQEFKKMFGIGNIIVARPDVVVQIPTDVLDEHDNHNVFIYSAYPRPFKNFEVICQACRKLEDENLDFSVWLTIDGTENQYSEMICKEYSDVKSIRWLGIVSRDEMLKKYGESDCLIFPSLLETWGLPITEYKQYGKPMLCADLPYAYETVGSYDEVSFFDPTEANELAAMMREIIKGEHRFSKVVAQEVEQPVVNGWDELFKKIS